MSHPNHQPRLRPFFMYCTVFLLGIFIARLPATIAYYTKSADWSVAINEVRELIENRYVNQVDTQQLQQAAINGMIDSLNDRYTTFVPPAKADDFRKDVAREFVGIGAQITIEDGWLTCISPMEDSPALAAGLLPGDRIEAIEDQVTGTMTSTYGKSVDECIALLRGQPSVPVKLNIRRAETLAAPSGDAAEQTTPLTLNTPPTTITIVRKAIVGKSVRGLRYIPRLRQWDYIIDREQAIAYIRFEQFTPTATNELIDAIGHAQRQLTSENGSAQAKLGGLIIDLRDNGGGVLDGAVAIADLFLDSGTIVSTRGREDSSGTPTKSLTLTARAGQIIGDVPLVILVNEQSASASEVLAGALQDQTPPRALVVGARSFGKGLVQVLEPIYSIPGATLKLTEQHYYLPSGTLIQRTDNASQWGVDPTPGFYVPMDEAQRIALARNRRTIEGIRPAAAIPPTIPEPLGSLEFNNPAWLTDTYGDPQLATELQAVYTRVASGQFTPPASGSNQPEQSARIGTTELVRLDKTREQMLFELDRLDQRITAIELGQPAVAGQGADKRNPRPASLWADAKDLLGGTVVVADKGGKPVATLRIIGPSLERYLLEADVEPLEPPAPLQPDASPPSPAK